MRLFEGMSQKQIDEILIQAGAEERIFEAGQYIFTDLDYPRYLYILRSGSVTVEKNDGDGNRIIVNRFNKKDTVFGEVYIYLDKRYESSCAAAEESRVTVIPLEYFKGNEKIPNLLTDNLLKILSTKAFMLNQKVYILSCNSLREKLFRFFEIAKDDKGLVRLTMNREELADFLSVTRPSLSRELMKLKDENGHKDFSEIIEMAKKCPAPDQIESGEIVGGFAHKQVIDLAGQVIEAINNKAITKFIVMAGCDGRHDSRSYYTDFAKSLPEDTIILTAGCAKYRYNKLGLGDINGIPRVLDAGQCNDSYSLVLIALELQKALGLDSVNDLPIVYNIAWYEQKAVIVLLALLSLGVKNIHLGPSLPAFLSKNVVKVLVDNFGISGISTVEEDMKAWVTTEAADEGHDFISENTILSDIVTRYPQSLAYFQSIGMHCLGCHASRFENLGQAALVHGLSVEKIIEDLKELIGE